MFVTEWNSGYVFGVTSLDIKTIGFMIMVGCSFESNFEGLDWTFFKPQKFPFQNSRTNIWHMTPGVTKTSHTCTNIQNPEKPFVNALRFTRISRKKNKFIFPKVLIKVYGMYGMGTIICWIKTTNPVWTSMFQLQSYKNPAWLAGENLQGESKCPPKNCKISAKHSDPVGKISEHTLPKTKYYFHCQKC